jgi:hypothetical protein
MPDSPIGWMNAPIHPALMVDAVNCNQLNLAICNQGLAGAYHTKIFVFEKSASLGRKNDRWFASIPIDLELHLLVQLVAPQIEVFNFHRRYSHTKM